MTYPFAVLCAARWSVLGKRARVVRMHRYLSEFDFRYNNRVALGVNDGERAALAVKGIEGKRLTYQTARV